MAWYTPTHKCGHTSERIQLYGKETGRQKYLASLAQHDCADCRVATANSGEAEVYIRGEYVGVPVPALTGSPKQIAWAADLRKPLVRAMTEAQVPPADLAWDLLRDRTEARWWIDNQRLIRGTVAQFERAVFLGDPHKPGDDRMIAAARS